MYPGVKYESGKRAMLKVDSGPVCLNSNILAYTRNLIFIIYPILPNTNAVTKETYQSYGPFKTQFIEKLNMLSDARIIHNDSTTL